jgi:hypothetical protein
MKYAAISALMRLVQAKSLPRQLPQWPAFGEWVDKVILSDRNLSGLTHLRQGQAR